MLERGIGSIKVIHQVAIDNQVVSEEFLSYDGGKGETVTQEYVQALHLARSPVLLCVTDRWNNCRSLVTQSSI